MGTNLWVRMMRANQISDPGWMAIKRWGWYMLKNWQHRWGKLMRALILICRHFWELPTCPPFQTSCVSVCLRDVFYPQQLSTRWVSGYSISISTSHGLVFTVPYTIYSTWTPSYSSKFRWSALTFWPFNWDFKRFIFL